jgi:excisionase family DNA binding protein
MSIIPAIPDVVSTANRLSSSTRSSAPRVDGGEPVGHLADVSAFCDRNTVSSCRALGGGQLRLQEGLVDASKLLSALSDSISKRRGQKRNCIGRERMSSSSSTAKENTQMSHQAVMQPALESRESESPAVAFERVLNTEEAAALLQIHPKTLQKMAREGSVPAFRIGDLWRFRASTLDEWLRSGVCSKRHSCR